jgi:hypothetical protein
MSRYQGPPLQQIGYGWPERRYGQPPYMAPYQYLGYPVSLVPQGSPPPNQQRQEQVSQDVSLIRRGPAVTTPQQVSSSPIPVVQKPWRSRRRYNEIERVYKCGWQGCEKAYGTLNHLNIHVSDHTHGPKRTSAGMLPYIMLRYIVAGEQLDSLCCGVTHIKFLNRPAGVSNWHPKPSGLVLSITTWCEHY